MLKLKKSELKKFEKNRNKYFKSNFDKNLINKKFRDIFKIYKR